MGDSSSADFSSLESEISALTMHQSLFQKQLENINESVSYNCDVNSDQVNDLEAQLQATITSCGKIAVKFTKVKKEYDARNTATDTLINQKEHEIGSLRLEIHHNNENYAVIKSELDNLTTQHEQLATDYETDRELHATSAAENVVIEEKLKKTKFQRKKAENKIKHLESEIQDSFDRLDQMETTMSTVKRKHTTDRARLVKDNIDSTERNDQLEYDSQIKSGENLRLHEEYRNVENKLKIITATLEELEAKLEQADKDLNSAQKEKKKI